MAVPSVAQSPNIQAQIDQINQSAEEENAINMANTQAKLATMGLKAAKELVG
ncbi:hypothetical protein QS306_09485 [Paraburkholderia bonniea]|uniref:hypothetical protein n=1 Tax=Paraburkholderia bonniea TaxID=2152891 RepID=UPI001580DF0D|nr:hypothetical protein [Paraburkholderia bonniea]WJF89354.1 hypothetical protein QS306_09485 [Paraburkholderia bonniea]WJF92669.1 hypothetical protein QS308_09495 [Paraburkholderia bonniea]